MMSEAAHLLQTVSQDGLQDEVIAKDMIVESVDGFHSQIHDVSASQGIYTVD